MEGKRAQRTGGASHLTLQLVSITQATRLQNIEISVGKTPLFLKFCHLILLCLLHKWMAFLCLFMNCFDDGWSLWNLCSLDDTVKTLLRLHVCYRFVETLRLCRSDEKFSPGVSSTIVGFTLFRSVTLAHTATNNKTEVRMQCPYCWREKRKRKKGERKRNRSPGIAVRVGGSYLVKIIYYPHPRLIDAAD